MDAVATRNEGLRLLIAQELSYMQALWWMYTGRVCPVPPVWLAPFSYSPATFSDTLFGAMTMSRWVCRIGQASRGPARYKKGCF